MNTDDNREPLREKPEGSDQEELHEGNWVGPDSNPAAAGEEPDEGWIGPDSNPASGSAD